jgi:xylulokinase
LLDATSQLKATGYRPEDLVAVAVDSTSGTVLPVDASGQPLHAALMYNDSRSTPLVAEVHRAARALEEKLGYAFKDSFALPKILWLCRQDPTLLERTTTFIHAADYITGRLTGDFRVTDHSNALKTGFDLVDYRWPELIERDLGIPLEKFPRVVAPGEPIGHVSARAAPETGLSTQTQVVAGMTDGSAAQVASGATATGAWNSVLGTTLVIKGITDQLIKDPLGRVYCHLHPQGTWMPGGASNTGAEWIVQDYPGRDPAQLDAAASKYLPTSLISYPLARRGERFPFVVPEAQRFMEGNPADDLERYASQLEGLAYLERLAFDTLEQLGAEVGDTLFVTGGGSRSAIWSQVRATVLARQLKRPVISETAMGAALLAASHTLYQDLVEASREMVKIKDTVDPQAAWQQSYEDGYRRFVEACKARGYLL